MARDLVSSIVLLVAAAGYYYAASGIGRSALADEVGAAGLPIVYAFLLAAIAVLMGLAAVARSALKRAPPKSGDGPDTAYMLRRAGGVLAIGVAYLLVVTLVGYLVALVIVLAAMLIYFGEPPGGRVALVAVVGACLFWVLFDRLLGIPMPGIWGL